MVLWFYVQKHPKAQPAVVLVLKHLRRRGNSSSDRLREAGNRTSDPWFTRHRFIPYTTTALLKNCIFVIMYVALLWMMLQNICLWILIKK